MVDSYLSPYAIVVFTPMVAYGLVVIIMNGIEYIDERQELHPLHASYF